MAVLVDSEKVYMDTIRVLRKGRGWSQQTLADRLAELGVTGLGRGALAKVESGVRALRWHEALALAAALGTDPAYLASGGEEKVDVQITPQLVMRGNRLRAWLRGQFAVQLDSDDTALPEKVTDDAWIERGTRHLEAGFALIGTLINTARDGDDIEPLVEALDALADRHRRLKDQWKGV